MFEKNPNIMVEKLKAIFLKCGVAFDVVHHFHGAPVQGFIKETDSGKVINCFDKESLECYQLLCDFLKYAKVNNKTVMVNWW